MLPLTRKACGFTTLNDVNGKGYVPEFYTNDIENVNSQIKFWVNEKLPLDVFIQKMKDLIECQERQYIDAISGTGDFEFAEKFKYLEIGSAWFPMVAKGTNNRHLQQELNTEVSCSAPTLELKEITVNTLEDISSSNLPNFIFSDVAEDMILFAKQIFDQKKIRKSFNNDNQYEVPQKHSSYPITLTFTKTGLVKCKKRECLNYSTYGVCGHTLAVSAYTSSLTLFLQSLQKDRHNTDLLEPSNFGNPSSSGTKKGYKRVRSESISDKGAKKTKSTNRSIISPISSLELAKCKSLIKFNNQPEVPIGQSLGPKLPQPEPQLQPYELIKRCKQVTKCNGCGFLFDKTDEKLYILGRNRTEKLEPPLNNTK